MIGRILRALPPFKGKQRIARLLLKSHIQNGVDLLVTGNDDCHYKVPNLKENIGFEIFINGFYERQTINFISKQVSSNGLLLDVGANIGAIVSPVCKRRPDISAICLEASQRLFRYLQFNVQGNGIQKVSFVHKAIWSRDGEELDFFSPDEKYGKGSLAPVFTDHAEKILTVTLDKIAADSSQKIDFIKIDVEGFEHAAFLGGEKLLKAADSPAILFEFVDWAENLAKAGSAGAAQELLLKYGYNLYLLKDGDICNKLEKPVRKGSALIFATKRPVS